jgi:hypothetical protein
LWIKTSIALGPIAGIVVWTAVAVGTFGFICFFAYGIAEFVSRHAPAMTNLH